MALRVEGDGQKGLVVKIPECMHPALCVGSCRIEGEAVEQVVGLVGNRRVTGLE